MPRLSFCLYVSAVLHLSALLSSGVVLLEAGCACGCGAPFARTPPVLRFSNQHCRLSHRHSSSFRRRILYQKNPPHGRVRAYRLSVAALVTVRHPIHNRPSTATSTILQPPSNHHHTLIARASSHLPRQARTSSSLPHRSKTPCNHAQTRKRRAGRSPPACLSAAKAAARCASRVRSCRT